MKNAQSWGWLAAAVLAAGLNASYHDGGLQWAHRIADQVKPVSAVVVALASGHSDQAFAEAQVVMARNEIDSCRFSTALARVENRIARSQTAFARIETMSAREEAQLARVEANRARIEAYRARIEAQVAAQADRIPVSVRVSDAMFSPVTVKVPVCPRIRVNVPRPPMIRIPAPVIHLDAVGSGPV